MQVNEVMSKEVQRLHTTATVKEAAEAMKKLDVGMIPVYDGDRLVGMLSDRDITVRAIAAGKDPTTTQVEGVMTDEVLYCFEDDDVKHAAKMMQDQQIRRLVVLNRDKRLVGVVSLGDIAKNTSAQTAGKTIESVSKTN